ncbi:hypothetical protein FPOA_12468 [Fusarium poae]|uniref:Uncharacterized protein n=1 Tax=Fusarium poae TaxID=36050 RepID=A0A1B8A967_FUSPO|nr:hypothetical protein FPOA_12468 [Fusarium poae]
MAAFEQACKETVGKIRIPAPATEDAKQTVKGYLESTASGQWLVVVDNADDVAMMMGPEGIYASLPKSGTGCMLFTTRTMDVALAVADEDPKELEEMSEDEAKAFLEKLLPTSQADDEMATELLRTLTFLPLAISQAAAYMKRNKTSVAKYLSLLRDVNEEAISLLSREFPDRTRYPESRHAVASTWLISFEQIQKNDVLAAELLSFISQIEPRAIPVSMLPVTGTKESIEHAIGTLCGYAFLHRRKEEGMLDMHSLVHLAAGQWVDRDGGSERVRRGVISHLSTVFKSDDWEKREVWQKYMPHVLKAIQIRNEGRVWGKEECELGYWAGRCLYVAGRISETVKLLEHVVRVHRMTLAESHPDRLASQHSLAGAYRANGQVREAVELLEHVVKVKETTLAESHPDRLASQHALAQAYQANVQVTEAVKLLEHVVAIKSQVMAPSHPSKQVSEQLLNKWVVSILLNSVKRKLMEVA